MGDIKPCHNNPATSTEANLTKMFHLIDVERKREENREIEVFDYAKRAQWLRAAVLGANDGLISTASLMIGIGAVRKDIKIMMLTGVAGLVAGACSMAIGEFVSVYAQYDIEVAQMIREGKETHKEKLPNPFQAALASGLSFAVGAAVFIEDNKVRLGVVAAVVSLALLVFGGIGAVLGKVPLVKSSLRVLIGGWLAMVVTFGLIKFVNHVMVCVE